MKTTPGITQEGRTTTTSEMRKRAGPSIPLGPRKRLLLPRGGTAVLLCKAVEGGTCIPQAAGHTLWAGVEGKSQDDLSRGGARHCQLGLKALQRFTFFLPTPPPFLWPELVVIWVRLPARAYLSTKMQAPQSLALLPASRPGHLHRLSWPWLRSMGGWEITSGVCVCVHGCVCAGDNVESPQRES